MVRNGFLDSLKGIAIITVVYTHCLQFLGIDNYWHHAIFKFTYSFHMPLFMLISGYLSTTALELDLFTFLKKKATRLLLPCLSAAILVTFFNLIFKFDIVHVGIREFVGNLWYLRSLFICITIVKLCKSVFKNANVLYIAVICCFIALPIHIYHVNFMMPYFCIGYLVFHYRSYIRRRMKSVCIMSIVTYIFLWSFWDGLHTTYASPLKFFDLLSLQWIGTNNFDSYIIRLFIGLAGSAMVVSAVFLMRDCHIGISKLSKLGTYTLEIYTVHFLFINTGILSLCAIPYAKGWYEIIYCSFMTFILFMICVFFIRFVHKSNLATLLFFGDRLRNEKRK